MAWDDLWVNGRVATMATTDVALSAEADPAIPLADAVAVQGGRIAWVGRLAEAPAEAAAASRRHDLNGAWVTPGLIDCRNSLVFAGNRARDFASRLAGSSYDDIAQADGGLNASVRAIHAVDEETLFQQSAGRLKTLLAEGVTTIGLHSGLAADLAGERKILGVARRLGQQFPVTVRTASLMTRRVPGEFGGDCDDYIDSLVTQVLPALIADGLVDGVDVRVERAGFSRAQLARVLDAAANAGLGLTLIGDHQSDAGAAAFAARWQVRSAACLEQAREDGISAMAKAGTVAVLLPARSYSQRDARRPPIDLFRRYDIAMAVATGSDPIAAPVRSLLLAMNMACTRFRLTPEEALAGVTREAAKALGLADELGTIEPGKRADLAIWQIDDLAELGYWMGGNPCVKTVKDGRIIE